MSRLTYGVAVSAACALLFASGCGGGASVQSSSAGAPAMASDSAVARDQSVERQAKAPVPESGKNITSDVKVTQQDRQVIYVASMTVRAKEVVSATERAKQIVTAAGGYLSSEKSSSAEDSEASSAELEFKIPPARYLDVLASLGKELGKRLSVSQGTQDVTMQVADVESRLKSAQQALDSLRTLMKKADTIGQVLQVEREIAGREADLESLQAQQKELRTQVGMATLTLTVVGPVAVVEPPSEEPAGFLGGLASGWKALVSFTKVALTVLGVLLPWLVAAVPVVLLTIFLVRRSRGRRPAAVERVEPVEPQAS
ncbi:DUF4349 domain-containing protein [Nonomuraea sp. NPDC005983]|uniref:DUF4349 domain-containing protein n=1 Tax=Nonomuraea sp. NPDC005983 TaxID=3155595 RepID=UPI0033B9E692